MDDVTSTMEDNRLGVVLSAVDFSKAFNRLEHEHCLRTFVKRGASYDVLQLLGSFLGGRSMTVRVEGEQSRLRPVHAGAPQGSVLGCYLFNVGVDDLEEDFVEQDIDQHQEEAHLETFGRTDDFPATSTPRRVRNVEELNMSPVQASKNLPEFRMLPRVANVPPWLHKPKDPKIKKKSVKSYKFVDDGINTCPVNMRQAKLLVSSEGNFKEIVDKRTEGLLNHIAQAAGFKGMKINAKKTSLMCVSAASTFASKVRLQVQGQTVTSQNSMKILGVTLDSDGTFKTHVENLRMKLRKRTWALAKLRKKGLPTDKLVRTYACLIRPVVEYASPAWHGSITLEQSEHLERQQSQALKNIYGVGLSASKMRAKANIPTLWSRREAAGLKFIKKCVNNERCTAWFRERDRAVYSRRPNTRYPTYHENTARTDRYRNSPKNYLIRQLNNALSQR